MQEQIVLDRVRDVYRETGENPNEIIKCSEISLWWHFEHEGGAIVKIKRKYIDDYVDSQDSVAKSEIKAALNKFIKR